MARSWSKVFACSSPGTRVPPCWSEGRRRRLQRSIPRRKAALMLLTHSVQLDDAADEMLRARRREQARADHAVLRNEVLSLLLMKRPTRPAAYHRGHEVHEQEQRARAPGEGGMRPNRASSRHHTPGPVNKGDRIMTARLL